MFFDIAYIFLVTGPIYALIGRFASLMRFGDLDWVGLYISFSVTFTSAFLETLAFEYVILTFLCWYFAGIAYRTKLLFAASIASSVIFAVIHFGYAGVHAFYIQGVLGFSWCLLYVKCLHMKLPLFPSSIIGVAGVTVVHFLYNVIERVF